MIMISIRSAINNCKNPSTLGIREAKELLRNLHFLIFTENSSEGCMDLISVDSNKFYKRSDFFNN